MSNGAGKHRMSDEDLNAANAAAASILEAAGRSAAGRAYLAQLPASVREASYAMAADHRERMA